jgi:transcriptional regulator of arginine metabolism
LSEAAISIFNKGTFCRNIPQFINRIKLMHIFAASMHKYTMNSKQDRLLDLKRLISNKKISSQDELLEGLSGLGYEFTQATLSRDLKEIRAGKIHDAEKGAIYILQEQISSAERTRQPGISIETVHSVVFSYNFVIIKTFPGFASSVALFIDNFNKLEIAGTIAGDDTILLIPHENFTRREIQDALVAMLPGIKEKFSR